MAATSENMFRIFVCFLVLFPCVYLAKKGTPPDSITQVSDFKEIKKLLRTKNNVLIIYAKNDKSVPSADWKLYDDVAEYVKGQCTLLYVICGDDKKLCKKMKTDPTTVEVKHYKDGTFNKNYDRKYTVKSMTSFLRDPTGDIPWGEDNTAGDVIHIDTEKDFVRFIKKEKLPLLVMFYAPWCGFCKKLKPDFAAAATEVKGQAVLVGLDVERPELMSLRKQLNITGFPTILYYHRGEILFKYGGENSKQGIIDWLQNPGPPKEPEKEAEWMDEETHVTHLTEATFDEFLESNPSVLVMFYAPWCGHCKKMKPEYTAAAETLHEEGIEGILAAVDATKEKAPSEAHDVKGFPTVKYFRDGKFEFDFNERTADKIVEFMKNPSEPPPPPPPEPSWQDIDSEVVHLTDETFKSSLKKKKHALVMFYAPWCGHCKKAKPEFMGAAAQFADDNKVSFAAVDCTQTQEVCKTYDVTGYPTFIYLHYGKNHQKYTGGREEPDFVNFMSDPENPSPSLPAPSSPHQTWSDAPGHEHLLHLTSLTFDAALSQQDSMLVMFYAPWCGHCKAMKPAYAEAASQLNALNLGGVLATVDATTESSLAGRYQVKGYPTFKYFKNGEFDSDYDKGRTTENLVTFMQSHDPNSAQPETAKEEL